MNIFVDIDDTICYYKNDSDKTQYNLALPYLHHILAYR